MSKQLFDIDTFRAQPLPSEAEVMANWQGDIEKPVVSVLCNTFNQNIYIEDAFRGFLIQKTDFVFEVIVHDDASTDGTSDIVKDYAARYPQIFKPVIQTENQYSQGKKIISLSASYSKGRYIAICEGDDFWINENKLQKQCEALISYPDIKICFTSALGLYNDDSLKQLAYYGDEEKVISTSKVITGSGAYMPTASLFFQNDVIFDMPDWFEKAPVGDFYIQVIASMDSGALYLPISSCTYRIQAFGSWSSMNHNGKVEDMIKFRAKYNPTLHMMSHRYKKYDLSFKYLLFKSNTFILLKFLRRFEFSSFYKYLLFLIK